MADLLTLPTDYERTRGDLPELPLINMFPEDSIGEGKVILQSRSGLVASQEYSVYPVRGMYTEAGAFNGDTFSVLGTVLYRGTNVLGTIDGDGPVSMDSYSDYLFVCAGASIWLYDGTTLTTVDFPDGASVRKVLVAQSRLIAIEDSTQRIYWSEPLETTIPDLNFAEAENSPDRLLDMLYIGDSLILFGEATVEFWMVGADADIPFVPLTGRVYSRGIISTAACTKAAATFAWITEAGQVCLTEPTNIISSTELELRISTSSVVKTWLFNMDQTEHMAVTIDTETWCVNPLNPSRWFKFESYGYPNWEPHCYSDGVFGSSHRGRFLEWATTFIDPDDQPLERRFRAWLPSNTVSSVVSNIVIRTNSGETPYLDGVNANPLVEMRSSRDGGKLWSNWRSISLGAQGYYRKIVTWLSCGIFSYPGAMFEFRVTDPVPFRVSSVSANEPYGGF